MSNVQPSTFNLQLILILALQLLPAFPPLPAEPIYLGAWVPGAPRSVAPLEAFERAAGKRVAIVHWYQGWGAPDAPLEPALLRSVAARGALPMITWEAWDYRKGRSQPEFALREIIAGRHDGYIRGWARGLRDYGGPVLLRWGHEMNTATYPWGERANGNRPGEFVAAWRHLHDLFRAEGASNVQWVWAPNVIYIPESRFEPYYPGDRYVDWLALDGYNKREWGGWQPFDQLYGESYRRLLALPQSTPKPIMLSEWAADEFQSPRAKARWIGESLAAIPYWDRIRAIVWFNEKQPDADWRIESSDLAARAFRTNVAGVAYQERWPKRGRVFRRHVGSRRIGAHSKEGLLKNKRPVKILRV